MANLCCTVGILSGTPLAPQATTSNSTMVLEAVVIPLFRLSILELVLP
jgi:hypothetical protein